MREVRGEEALIMIVGNKCDLEGERAVDQSLAQSKIKELGLNYMEVSAKSGQNIKEFFKELAIVIAGGRKSKEETPTTTTNNKPQVSANPPKPQENNVDLSKAAKAGGKDRKKKGCC